MHKILVCSLQFVTIGHLHDDAWWRWVTTTTIMLCQYPSTNRWKILVVWYLWSLNAIECHCANGLLKTCEHLPMERAQYKFQIIKLL